MIPITYDSFVNFCDNSDDKPAFPLTRDLMMRLQDFSDNTKLAAAWKEFAMGRRKLLGNPQYYLDLVLTQAWRLPFDRFGFRYSTSSFNVRYSPSYWKELLVDLGAGTITRIGQHAYQPKSLPIKPASSNPDKFYGAFQVGVGKECQLVLLDQAGNEVYRTQKIAPNSLLALQPNADASRGFEGLRFKLTTDMKTSTQGAWSNPKNKPFNGGRLVFDPPKTGLEGNGEIIIDEDDEQQQRRLLDTPPAKAELGESVCFYGCWWRYQFDPDAWKGKPVLINYPGQYDTYTVQPYPIFDLLERFVNQSPSDDPPQPFPDSAFNEQAALGF